MYDSKVHTTDKTEHDVPPTIAVSPTVPATLELAAPVSSETGVERTLLNGESGTLGGAEPPSSTLPVGMNTVEGDGENHVPTGSESDPQKLKPSAGVHAVLRASKQKKQDTATVLQSALLALGPPGQMPPDQLMKELANLHAQVHAGYTPEPADSMKRPADAISTPPEAKTAPPAKEMPQTQRPLRPLAIAPVVAKAAPLPCVPVASLPPPAKTPPTTPNTAAAAPAQTPPLATNTAAAPPAKTPPPITNTAAAPPAQTPLPTTNTAAAPLAKTPPPTTNTAAAPPAKAATPPVASPAPPAQTPAAPSTAVPSAPPPAPALALVEAGDVAKQLEELR